jgi:dihydroxyacid dehydratase/phosphogluconate dehydratase
MTDTDKDRILAAYEGTGLCKTIRTADRIAATAQALGLPVALVAAVVGGEG